MKQVASYVVRYIREVNKVYFFTCTLITAAAVFINYRFHLNAFIYDLADWLSYPAWYLVFATVFIAAYLAQPLVRAQFSNSRFLQLMVLAPAVFAWKMAFPVSFHLTASATQNEYWNMILYWPLKLIVVTTVLYIISRAYGQRLADYGLQIRKFSARPYVYMLLLMIPLIAIAASESDFLKAYPILLKVELLQSPGNTLHKLLFELSYGSDFFTIELFFRGFLVLAFARFVGIHSILPMAMFYCTIHFGKPLGECISSYFGGLILGVVVYHTRSIYGGLMVHLGIAWLMELAGYLSHALS